MKFDEAQNVVQALAPSSYYATDYRKHERDYLPHLIAHLEKLFPLPDERCSLEVGPGWGTMVIFLAAAGWDVSVIDNVAVDTYIAPALLELTRAQYWRRDIFDRPLVERFDLILCTQVLLHLKFRPDLALGNIRSMLKPDGKAIISVLNAERYPSMATTHGLNGWRKLEEPSNGTPAPDIVTFRLDEAGFRDLLESVFSKVHIWLPEKSTVMFAEVAR